MPEKRNDLFAVLVLPLLFFGLTYGLIGFYYETNDDQIITLLLRGLTIQPALDNLSIYFFGFSQVLAGLYARLPDWPWYGLVLYGWLLVATMLAFWIVLRALPGGRPWQRGLLLAAFFFFCWLEHVMWFNYMRVPLLLAGTGFLFLLCWRREKAAFHWWPWLLSGGLFLAALCIRPSAALLGLLLTGPAALFWFPGPAGWRRCFAPLAFFLALALSILLWQQSRQTPAIRQYQQLDLWKSAILDYGIYEPRLQTRADSLAFTAIGHWFLADQQVIGEDFYRQHGRISVAYIAAQAPAKIGALLAALVRDQFFLLWGNALLLAWAWKTKHPRRRAFLGYSLYVGGLLLLLGVLLKMPPRVLTPCLSLYTLVQLFLLPRRGAWPLSRWQQLAVLLTLAAGLAYLVKVGHRAQFQRKRQQKQEQFIQAAALSSKGRVLVSSVLPDYFRSLSPLRNYQFGAQAILPLTGWSTLDPGFPAYYRRLSGSATFAEALVVLSSQPGTVWLLEPEFALFLEKYLQEFHGAALPLVRQGSLSEPDGLQWYFPAAK
jgi:hypothetical protein